MSSLLVNFQCTPIGILWSQEILVQSVGVGDLVEFVPKKRPALDTKQCNLSYHYLNQDYLTLSNVTFNILTFTLVDIPNQPCKLQPCIYNRNLVSGYIYSFQQLTESYK